MITMKMNKHKAKMHRMEKSHSMNTQTEKDRIFSILRHWLGNSIETKWKRETDLKKERKRVEGNVETVEIVENGKWSWKGNRRG